MTARLVHDIGDLTRDLERMPAQLNREGAEAVRDSAQDGNRIAAGLARQSAGAHGKHYHKAFTVERRTPLSYEYGPDASRPQGGMSFEFGSRNQPPHLDLAQSADIAGVHGIFGRRVENVLDRLFWP